MTRLNWEKQNKLEQPKDEKRRLDREKVDKAYANGAKNERQRILNLLLHQMPPHLHDQIEKLVKGKQK